MPVTHIATKTRIEAIKTLYPRDDGSFVSFADNPALYKAVVDYLAMQEMEREVKALKELASLDIKEAMKTAAEAVVTGDSGNVYRITFKAADVEEYTVSASVRRSLSVKKVTTPD